jgi:uncharacterized integral membrane protein
MEQWRVWWAQLLLLLLLLLLVKEVQPWLQQHLAAVC